MESIFTREKIEEYVLGHLWELTKSGLVFLYKDKTDLTPPKSSITKDALVQKVKEDKIDAWEIYQSNKECAFGLYPTKLQELLNIDKRQRLKMEKHGLIKVAYTKVDRAYGKYIDVPYYSLESLMEFQNEDVQEWKDKKDKKATPKQLESLEKARITKERLEEERKQKEWDTLAEETKCSVCGKPTFNYKLLNDDWECPNCVKIKDDIRSRNYAIKDCKNIMEHKDNYVIMDMETTGLSLADICSMSIVDMDGSILLDTLVKPSKSFENGATYLHGINAEKTAKAPSGEELKKLLLSAIAGRKVLFYTIGRYKLENHFYLLGQDYDFLDNIEFEDVSYFIAGYYGDGDKDYTRAIRNYLNTNNPIAKTGTYSLYDCFCIRDFIVGTAQKEPEKTE